MGKPVVIPPLSNKSLNALVFNPNFGNSNSILIIKNNLSCL